MDDSRRFTDREVALILRKASEIEEKQGGSDGGGLSLADLREIASEVGISQEAMDRAVRDLHRKGPPTALAGAPLVRRAVHVVDGRLDDAGLQRLMRVVDERADAAGNVTEALGAVRWTSDDRISSTQVSVGPEGGRTRIQVVEKMRPRIRRVLHLVPAAWGLMLAAPLVEILQPGGAAIAAGAVAATAAGAGLGRLAWSFLSARSEARVARLAEELSREARAVARPGGADRADSG